MATASFCSIGACETLQRSSTLLLEDVVRDNI